MFIANSTVSLTNRDRPEVTCSLFLPGCMYNTRQDSSIILYQYTFYFYCSISKHKQIIFQTVKTFNLFNNRTHVEVPSRHSSTVSKRTKCRLLSTARTGSLADSRTLLILTVSLLTGNVIQVK